MVVGDSLYFHRDGITLESHAARIAAKPLIQLYLLETSQWMNRIRLLLFTLVLLSFNVYAIEPPVFVYPADGDTNVNYGPINFKFQSFQSGLRLELEIDTTLKFNSFYLSESWFSTNEFRMWRPEEFLGHIYYARARMIDPVLKDTSNWATIKYRTSYGATMTVSRLVTKNELNYVILPSDKTVEIWMDTTKDLNSRLLVVNRVGNGGTWLKANRDSTWYYYKARTINPHDTSSFSPIDSFFTSLDFNYKTTTYGCLSNGDVTIWARYYLKKPKLNDTYSTSRLQNTIYINIL